MSDHRVPLPVPAVLGLTPPAAAGLCCPKCRCRHLPAVRSRRVRDTMIRTRRCRHCGQEVTTREQITDAAPKRRRTP